MPRRLVRDRRVEPGRRGAPRSATALAARLRFDEAPAGKLAIVATEPATNLVKHAGGGGCCCARCCASGSRGVELLALDRGPGMRDVAACLRDGYSTAGSPGTGLGAIAAPRDAFDIYSRAGAARRCCAASLCVRIAPRRDDRRCERRCRHRAQGRRGGLRRRLGGRADADGCHVRWSRTGSGHGPEAAAAAARVPSSSLRAQPHRGAAPSCSSRCHARSARDARRRGRGRAPRSGAEASELRRRGQHRRHRAAGGTSAGTWSRTTAPSATTRASRRNSPIRGPPARCSVAAFRRARARSWSLGAIPACATRHPTLIAAVALPRLTRDRDDVTVVVLRSAGGVSRMSRPILHRRASRTSSDVVAVRQRARQIAELLGFDSQDQTRIATAVSEIARNAFRYAGGGKVEFALEGGRAPQLLVIRVSDAGPGIRDLDARPRRAATGPPPAWASASIGARRLMDRFEIESSAGARHRRSRWASSCPRARAARRPRRRRRASSIELASDAADGPARGDAAAEPGAAAQRSTSCGSARTS